MHHCLLFTCGTAVTVVGLTHTPHHALDTSAMGASCSPRCGSTASVGLCSRTKPSRAELRTSFASRRRASSCLLCTQRGTCVSRSLALANGDVVSITHASALRCHTSQSHVRAQLWRHARARDAQAHWALSPLAAQCHCVWRSVSDALERRAALAYVHSLPSQSIVALHEAIGLTD